MPTDLFKQYYNNPKKQYIYSDIICPGADSNDGLKFTITDSAGIISNSDGVQAKVDYSNLEVDLTSYANNSIILQPNSINPIIGTSHGEQQMTRGFGYFDDETISEEQWKYFITVSFVLKYRYNGRVCKFNIYAESSSSELIDIETAIQNALDAYEIPISVFLVDNYFMLIGNNPGFEFFVDNARYCVIDNDKDFNSPFNTPINDSSIEPYCDVLYELEDVYVPAMKYKNGAFRGISMRVNYPMYNDSSITHEMRTIKLAYVKDRVFKFVELISGTDKIYYKNVVDVDVNYKCHEEYKALRWLFPLPIKCEQCQYGEEEIEPWTNPNSRYHKKRNTEWISPANPDTMQFDDSDWYNEVNNTDALPRKITIHVSPRECVKKLIGLYGYADYVEKNNLWTPIGNIYINTAASDSETTRNLLPSIILYNPNDYPIEVKLMTFI